MRTFHTCHLPFATLLDGLEEMPCLKGPAYPCSPDIAFHKFLTSEVRKRGVDSPTGQDSFPGG